MTDRLAETSGAADYFNQLKGIFEASAAANGGSLDFGYGIASLRLQLSFAGPTLIPYLVPSLVHLAANATGTEQLTISVWDETTATEPIPPPPWSWNSYMSRGEVGAYDRDSFRIWFDIGTGLFSMIDLESNHALLWARDPARLPIYVTAAPFRMILQAWLSRRGLYFAHAAAVGNAHGAVMLVGTGGAGKSTTSLVCLAGGMDFLGDDYCLFGVEPEALVHSAYCSAKLDREMLQRLPEFQSTVHRGNDLGEDKALLMLGETYSTRLARSRPVRALLVPRVTKLADTVTERISALEGIRAIAPSTMQQIAGPDPSAWRAITALARKLPSFRINVGYDLEQIPQRINQLLEQLAST